jgi:hypothetical protein
MSDTGFDETPDVTTSRLLHEFAAEGLSLAGCGTNRPYPGDCAGGHAVAARRLNWCFSAYREAAWNSACPLGENGSVLVACVMAPPSRDKLLAEDYRPIPWVSG